MSLTAVKTSENASDLTIQKVFKAFLLVTCNLLNVFANLLTSIINLKYYIGNTDKFYTLCCGKVHCA